MQRYGERFEERPFSEADAGRDGHQAVFRHRYDVAEVAWLSARAKETDVIAQIMAAAPAHRTVVAEDGRFEKGAVAGLPAADPGAGLDHRAGGFMAQDHGIDAGRVTHRAFREVVEVRATDTAEVDTDLDFAGAWIDRGGFRDLEAVLSDEFSDSHLFLKEILKCRARVAKGAGHMRHGRLGDNGRFGRFRRFGGLAGDRDARGKQGALVALVLGCNALGDGLGALEVGGGIEMGALPAAVEFGGAFGAGLSEVEPGGKRGDTVVATAGGNVPHHLRKARRCDIH